MRLHPLVIVLCLFALLCCLANPVQAQCYGGVCNMNSVPQYAPVYAPAFVPSVPRPSGVTHANYAPEAKPKPSNHYVDNRNFRLIQDNLVVDGSGEHYRRYFPGGWSGDIEYHSLRTSEVFYGKPIIPPGTKEPIRLAPVDSPSPRSQPTALASLPMETKCKPRLQRKKCCGCNPCRCVNCRCNR